MTNKIRDAEAGWAEGKTIARSITPVNLVGSGASGWNTKSCQTYRACIVRLNRRSGSSLPFPNETPPVCVRCTKDRDAEAKRGAVNVTQGRNIDRAIILE